MATSDPEAVAIRRSVGLATLDPSTITVVTDARTRSSILVGINAIFKTP